MASLASHHGGKERLICPLSPFKNTVALAGVLVVVVVIFPPVAVVKYSDKSHLREKEGYLVHSSRL